MREYNLREHIFHVLDTPQTLGCDGIRGLISESLAFYLKALGAEFFDSETLSEEDLIPHCKEWLDLRFAEWVKRSALAEREHKQEGVSRLGKYTVDPPFWP